MSYDKDYYNSEEIQDSFRKALELDLKNINVCGIVVSS